MTARTVRRAAGARYTNLGRGLSGAFSFHSEGLRLVRLPLGLAPLCKKLNSTRPRADVDGTKAKSAAAMEALPERESGSAASRQ